MDVRSITAGVGIVATLAVAATLGTPFAAVAAGGAGALVVFGVGRGTAGTAAASLALAGAILLAAFGASAAETAAGALAALAAAVGIAGCLGAAVDDGGGDGIGVGAFVGAWAALSVLPVGWFAVSVAAAQPAGSLLGARLAWLGLPGVTLVVPVAIAASVGAAAVGGWRDADLPPFLLTLGPAGALVAGATLFSPSSPDVDALLAGTVATAPLAYALLWTAAVGTFGSALAGTVAAAEPRFRRPPMWLAVAAGPALLGLVVALDGGVFVRSLLAVFPPASEAVGAIAETAPPDATRSFVAAATLAGLTLALVVPVRAPVLSRAVAGRPAGVGAGCLLVAVALTGGSPGVTALAGSLAVVAWASLAAPRAIEPPPRTALARIGVIAASAGIGAVTTLLLTSRIPTADPGVGGVLLLSGVVALGLSMR